MFAERERSQLNRSGATALGIQAIRPDLGVPSGKRCGPSEAWVFPLVQRVARNTSAAPNMSKTDDARDARVPGPKPSAMKCRVKLMPAASARP